MRFNNFFIILYYNNLNPMYLYINNIFKKLIALLLNKYSIFDLFY